MKDERKTKAQLISELDELRRVAGKLKDVSGKPGGVEDELRKQRDYLESILGTAPVIILVLDTRGGIVSFNPFMEKLCGYSLNEARGRDWFETFLPNRDSRSIRKIFRETAGDIDTSGTTNPIVTKDGREIDIEWNNKTLKDIDGNVIGVLAVGHDITGRREIENVARIQRDLAISLGSTRDMESALAHLLDTVMEMESIDSGGIYLVDEETGDLHMVHARGLSKAFVKKVSHYKYDYPSTRLAHSGKPVYGSHSEISPKFDDVDKAEGLRALAVIPVPYEGKLLACLNLASHKYDEIPVAARTSLEAIAAHLGGIISRIRAEEALRESEEKYRAVVENASQCIIVVQDEQIKYSNPMVHEVLGYTWDELTALGPYGVIHPEDREMIIERHKKRMKGEAVEDSYQHRLIRKDGQAVWAHVNAVPIEWEGRWAVMILAADITDRKMVEDALRRSEREKAIVLDTVSEFVCFYGRDYRFIWANRITAETLGVTSEELVGRYCFELWHNRSEPCDGCPSTRVFETGLPVEVEIDKGIGKLWFVRSYPVFDEEGNVSGAVEVATDITARKAMEAALRDSEEQLRLITDSLPAMIGYVDSNQSYQFVNKAYEKMFKKPKADIISRHIKEMVGEEGYETIRGYLETALSGKTVSFETRITLIDGTSLYVHGTYIPDFDEDKNVRGFFALVTDITERKEAERDLHLMQFSIEKAADSVFWSLPDARIINVNNAACRELGYSRDELLGMNIHDIDPLFTEEVWPQHWEDLRKHKSFTIQSQHRRKDGTTFPVEILLNHIEFDGQEYNFAFARDITGRKRAEEERRKMVEEIRHAQKLESLAVLAGGVAHDFNNLLMGILGFSELAQMELGPESPARHSVEQIEKAALHAADLTKQMLAYSGKGMFVVEPLNLSKLISEMSHLFKAVVSKKALLKFNLTENIPSVECDATQVRQIVMNLVTNASEAIGENSGIITISTGIIDCDMAYFSTAYLREDLEEGPYVCLEVTDTGAGMDSRIRAKIFDPFFTTKFTGRGLGLAAVLGIVRGHKGTIRVGSEAGKGTTFEVLLPVSSKAVGKTLKAEESAGEWSGSGMLLVVDDEESVRTVAKLAMKRAGFTVITAVDGLEGVEKFREHKDEIVAVLLDMTMPRMSGKEAFREMRLIRDDIKVILSSGYNEQDATSRFSEKGLAGFIQKPYRPSELIEKLRRIMQD